MAEIIKKQTIANLTLQHHVPWQNQLLNQTFSFAKFYFNLLAMETIYVPEYKGSALRGGFGNVFRKVCCTKQVNDCLNCLLVSHCPYAYVFETPQNSALQIEHKADNYPHPFVIEPLLDNVREYKSGEKFQFGLILFGKALAYLPYFIYTFHQLGNVGLGKGRGRFKLLSVESCEDLWCESSKKQVYDFHSETLSGDFKIFSVNDFSNSHAENENIQISFETPTRIMMKKNLVKELTPEIFIRSLLRRISWLGKIHCEGDWNLPYREIVDYAAENLTITSHHLKWHDWQRYSTRQHRRMILGGFVGEVEIAGALKPLLPLIYLGQFTHVGKNTTFGLGKYTIYH